MATDTKLEASGQVTSRGGPPGLRQLWQVPAFLTGVLAVLGVVASIPYLHEPGLRLLDHDLAAIRKALDRPGAPGEDVLARAERALARTEQNPERVGEAHFLLGSVQERLADQAPAARAALDRQKALAHLEQAEKLGVPPGDRLKLTYRLGKVSAQIGQDPARVIEYLSRSIAPAADDPAQGYRLLAQAYLDLPAPNLEAAYEAGLKLLALPIDSEEVLGPARLLCGDILLRQRRPVEALKMLTSVGDRAPRPVQTRARYLQGVCCQQLNLWDRAIPAWQAVLRDPGTAAGDRGQILYYLGLCYRNLEQPDEAAAARAWAEAVRAGGDSGRAAALCVGELHMFAGCAGKALEAFARALDGLSDPGDYQSPLIPLDKARDKIEYACHYFTKGREFDSALRLALLYKKIALPGVAANLEGQAAEGWARELEAEPRPGDAAARRREQQVRSLFVRAGGAFQEAAATRLPGDQPRVLWQSASCFLRGGDYPRAAAMLEKFVACGVADEWRGEGWFTLAEARLVLGQKEPARLAHWKDQARKAYYKAIEYPGQFAHRARYQLARAELEAKAGSASEERSHLDQAEALLRQNLEPKLANLAPDAYEKSLFELAGLLFRRRQFDKAQLRYQEAVDRYPDNPRVRHARQQLAECFRQLAYQEISYLNSPDVKADAQIYHRRRKDFWLERAEQHYQKLADDLEKLAAAGKLPADGQAVLSRSLFAVADCRFEQGEYEEALRRFKLLAQRYAQRPECLIAYQNVWRCAGVLRRTDDARDALDKALAALKELPDDAFTGPQATSREEWQKWIDSRRAQLPGPARKQ
jgi:tetratricopeptide (TPR) repeat protein